MRDVYWEYLYVDPFHATNIFLYPLKISENLDFSYGFRGYRKNPVTWNGLMLMRSLFEKRSFADVFQNSRCSKKYCNIHWKTPVLKSLLNKNASLKACNFIKKRFQHICFPKNIAKYLRAAFFFEHLRGLLLLFWLAGRAITLHI